MDPQEAARLLERGEAVAVDVREPAEWDAGRIRGSVHIPMRELVLRRSELPRETTIVAVCRTGNRSGAVTQALRNAGYSVENLEGGLKAWVREGLVLDPPGGRVI